MRFKNLVDIFYSLTIFSTSLVVKEEDNLWLFGAQGGYSYSDNSKYFFEWLLDNHPNENCFWVTKDKGIYEELLSQGLPAIYFYNISSLLKMAKAKYIVCTHSHTGNDVYKFIALKKKLVTLWHGIPLKKMRSNKRRSFLELFNIKSQPNLFLVTSARDADLFSTLYEIDREQFYIGSYPRIVNLVSSACDSNVILYTPTYRDGKDQNYYNDYVFPTEYELEELNNNLVESNHRLVIKLHPYTNAEFPNLSGLSHIELCAPYDDVQALLRRASILITDYSSIYFDYLHLDRDIIFYIPDFDWYHDDNNRGLLYDYDEVTPGIKAHNWKSLNYIIHDTIHKKLSEYSQKRQEVSNYFYENKSSNNISLLKKCKSL